MTSKPGRIGVLIFGIALIIGFIYAGSHLFGDLQGIHPESALPFILLGIALLTALGFEFVNGFHDTANAVATVIYTHSLEPHVAVVWSGAWNFIGVLLSSGAVAFSIVLLLPVELILAFGSVTEKVVRLSTLPILVLRVKQAGQSISSTETATAAAAH
jgi:PiT family inorganic phosphate transporter